MVEGDQMSMHSQSTEGAGQGDIHANQHLPFFGTEDRRAGGGREEGRRRRMQDICCVWQTTLCLQLYHSHQHLQMTDNYIELD